MTLGVFMSIRYFTCNCHTNPDTVCRHDNDARLRVRGCNTFMMSEFVDGEAAESSRPRKPKLWSRTLICSYAALCSLLCVKAVVAQALPLMLAELQSQPDMDDKWCVV